MPCPPQSAYNFQRDQNASFPRETSENHRFLRSDKRQHRARLTNGFSERHLSHGTLGWLHVKPNLGRHAVILRKALCKQQVL